MYWLLMFFSSSEIIEFSLVMSASSIVFAIVFWPASVTVLLNLSKNAIFFLPFHVWYSESLCPAMTAIFVNAFSKYCSSPTGGDYWAEHARMDSISKYCAPDFEIAYWKAYWTPFISLYPVGSLLSIQFANVQMCITCCWYKSSSDITGSQAW